MVNASVQGASHIRRNIPCEDYSMVSKNEYCQIWVLGDGHGDTNCPRSSRGAQYICEITVECLVEFEKNIRECVWTDDLFDKKKSEELIRQLIRSIIGRWTEKVSEEFSDNPLTENELSGLSEDYALKYKERQHIGHIYGTTLIAGLMTDRYLLLIQQGDGRCVVFDKGGNPSQPIPWDEKCMANITTSVCDADAVSRCRYKVIDLVETPVIACFSGSDGVEDSFSSFDSMYSFYRMLISRICKSGTFETEKYLMEYLPEFSKKGSGDDTSLCGIIDIEAAKDKLDKFSLDSEIVRLRDTLKSAEERIPQMEGKLAFLKSQYDRMKTEVANDVNSEINKLKKDRSKLCEKLKKAKEFYQKKYYESIERPLFEAKAERCRFSSYEERCNISIWENRCSSLSIHFSRNYYETIKKIEASIIDIDRKIKLIQSSSSGKIKECNEAEKEYNEYNKKYAEVVSIKDKTKKRLLELSSL